MEAIIGEKKLTIISKDGEFVINGKQMTPDIQKIGESSFNIIHNRKVYEVEIVKVESKAYEVKVNGMTYPLILKDELDLTLEKLGIDQASSKADTEIKAPMPGLILQVLAKEGDAVSKGDSLLILEAMKMENVIKSPVDGVISKVEVAVGDSVDKGKILCRF